MVRDGPGYRLFNRRGVEITPRYPEFSFLNGLPAGTILDGELVVLERGKPSLAKLAGPRERGFTAEDPGTLKEPARALDRV